MAVRLNIRISHLFIDLLIHEFALWLRYVDHRHLLAT